MTILILCGMAGLAIGFVIGAYAARWDIEHTLNQSDKP